MDSSLPIRVHPGEPGRIIVLLPYSPERVAKIKTIPGRAWDLDRKHWTVPKTAGIVARLRELFAGETLDVDPSLAGPAAPPLTPEQHRARDVLVEHAREAVRARQFSPRTEDAYAWWARKFLEQTPGRPEDLGEPEIARFLTGLAVDRHVSASTQNQALNALLFFFQNVLRKEIGLVGGVVRAKRPERLPVVLSRLEVAAILARMDGTPRLMAMLLYGGGLRLMECCCLRVKDIDFDRRELTVRAGKGNKDRRTILPEAAREPLRRHLQDARRQHEEDLARGLGAVALPGALERKYPNASKEWCWQWAFPASSHYADEVTGERKRHHLHETVVQKAFKDARLRSGVAKAAGCHTLRHYSATHLLEDGYDIRTIQELLAFRRGDHDDLHPRLEPRRLRRQEPCRQAGRHAQPGGLTCACQSVCSM